MVRRLGGFDGERQAHCFGDRDERGEARIAAWREGAVEAFPLDACRLGDFGKAPARFCNVSKGDQQHLRFFRILHRRSEILGRESPVLPQFFDHHLVVRDARFVFHGF